MESQIGRAIIAGVIAVIFGLIATFLVQLVVPTTNLTWSLIAVGFASFFAGVAGYISGNRHEEQQTAV